MTKSILFTFDDVEDRQKFIDSIKSSINNDESIGDENYRIKLQSVIDNAKLDPSILSSEHRHCSIWVSGGKIAEGDYKTMNERFLQECGVHSASVILKELKNNKWCDIRTRRLQ